ncbi:unnamed protein product [Lactuca saligna]|uniref:Uncharacterized protein n=1 Tax=Lactuca saligna TaxID=75948 RepID=A0AA35YD07_LACSI|nr:unnamed protein product [Lactuca saligna]
MSPQTSNMDPVFVQVDVHFHRIFAKYPIRYTGGISQRLSNIDFVGMDKIGCYEFIERFTREKCTKLYYYQPNIHFPKGLTLILNEFDYVDFIAIAYECGAILPMYVDHFGNTSMHEWLEEHKEEVVDSIVEEVLDGLGIVKEIKTNEDNHNRPYFIKKDNGLDVEMGDNATLGGPLEEAMDEDEDVLPQLPNIFNEKLHWKEQGPLQLCYCKCCGIVVSMSQCRRAKKYALSLVEGTIAENYARIWSYGEEIKRLNPGSNVKNLWIQCLMVRITSTRFTYVLKQSKKGGVEGVDGSLT